VASFSPAKISLQCPHCGFQQMDYAAAKSTMCRQCGQHYVPAAPAAAAPKSWFKPELPQMVDPSTLRRKFDGLWAKARLSVIQCFECKAQQEVSAAASSTICPACSAHIDLQDYKITTSFSRTIRSHGNVHITARGDLSSNTVICSSALIEGKLRGNLHCAESATINFSGKVPGRLVANHVLVERRADVQFFRRLTVRTIEIRGRMSGEIVAEGVVVIHKTGSLEGNVTAPAISVEKGGKFCGQLVIGGQNLRQAELLPEPGTTGPLQEEPPPQLVSPPLPATS
jgi:cytoskeletal protein CcmA (bactofilin family)/ribosomal protein S27E